MNISIKNMVCNRCILVVQQVLDRLGIAAKSVKLGEVETDELDQATLSKLGTSLDALGFELLDDNRKKIIERIKTLIIQKVHHRQESRKENLSQLLSETLHKDYSYLSNLFSETEGITIEKYVINQKIERAKELIIYNELSMSEIAFELGYSSTAHLSAQFKRSTGLSPGSFKKMGQNRRKPLDSI